MTGSAISCVSWEIAVLVISRQFFSSSSVEDDISSPAWPWHSLAQYPYCKSVFRIKICLLDPDPGGKIA